MRMNNREEVRQWIADNILGDRKMVCLIWGPHIAFHNYTSIKIAIRDDGQMLFQPYKDFDGWNDDFVDTRRSFNFDSYDEAKEFLSEIDPVAFIDAEASPEAILKNPGNHLRRGNIFDRQD